MGTLPIRVVEIKQIQNTKSLRALCTIQVGPVVFYKVRLVQQKNQRAYIQPPQVEYIHPVVGNTLYAPMCKWPSRWSEEILDAVQTELIGIEGNISSVDTSDDS